MGRSSVVACLVVVSLSASVATARSRKVDHLARILTPSEQDQFLRMWASLVDAAIVAARTAKHECSIATFIFDGRSTLQAPTRAFVVPGGLAPEFRRVTLDCDAKAREETALTISLSAEMSPRLRVHALPPKGAKRGSNGWWLSSNDEAMYLDSDSPDAGQPHAALEIRVTGAGRDSVKKALLAANLGVQLSGLVPLPVPMPPPVAAVTPGPDTERAVVSAVVGFFAGADGGVVVSQEPSRGGVEIDAETLQTLRVSTPDLDPALFSNFLARLPSGALPALPSNARLREVDTHDWDEFHRVYPGAAGELTLSPITFSSDGSQAVLIAGYLAGPLYGHGALYVLQRAPSGAWAIIYENIFWMA